MALESKAVFLDDDLDQLAKTSKREGHIIASQGAHVTDALEGELDVPLTQRLW